jgi:hypothetical protein
MKEDIKQIRIDGAGEEIVMLEGTLIAESLRVGTTLADLNLTVRKISRYRAGGTTPDQPGIWTTLDFEADESGARELTEVFAAVLDQPGWYVNFQSPAESFIVFPGKIFRYPRGDAAGRAAAQAYGRQLAIPDPQLDWTV